MQPELSSNIVWVHICFLNFTDTTEKLHWRWDLGLMAKWGWVQNLVPPSIQALSKAPRNYMGRNNSGAGGNGCILKTGSSSGKERQAVSGNIPWHRPAPLPKAEGPVSLNGQSFEKPPGHSHSRHIWGEGDWFRVGRADKADKNAGCKVKFEFQVNMNTLLT